MGELTKAVAFEAGLADEWKRKLEDDGHFWAQGRCILERIILVITYRLSH